MLPAARAASDSLMQEQSSPTSHRRPVLITILCVLAIGATVISFPLLAYRASLVAERQGVGYAIQLALSLHATVISLIGYWKMRRWGVYLYTAAFVLGSGWGLATGASFTIAGVVTPLGIIALGLCYIRRMV